MSTEAGETSIVCSAHAPSYVDLRDLAGIPGQRTVTLVSATLDDLSAMPPLELEELQIQDVGIKDLSGIENLRRLDSLVIAATAAPRLGALAKVPTLERLQLPVDAATDLTPIAKLEKLSELELTVDKSELPKLPAMTQLKALKIWGQVTDLAPVAALSGLERLVLEDTAVKELRPLHVLKGLKRLELRETPVTPAAVKAFKQAVPKCEVVRR